MYLRESGNADGALFNPAAFSDPNNELPGGSNNVYYTTATFSMTFNTASMTFNTAPSLILTDEWSPFVRMQNVGIEGEGSLKLPGSPIPEPMTLVLVGSGPMGLAGLGRKKFKKS